MKYLITGKNGQLARAFIKTFEDTSIDFSAPEESQLDITNSSAVAAVVAAYKPDIILNCAAYNLVDKAEQDSDSAFRVNAVGPKNLAQAAAKQKAFLVHFGSDYVFDGKKENGLYTEADSTNPLSSYGRSKLAGEDSVLGELAHCLVFRLSWVYGEGTQNFIHKLVQWSKSSEYLKITCDEFSVPTSAETVVEVTMKALQQGVTGRYHLTNTGFCSRYEWARMVLGALSINKFIRPTTMAEFKLPAQRPQFSAMSNATVSKLLNMAIPAWEEAVQTYLRKRNESNE
jgi:dTDP-4-dehydrorhamnose reductase